ncbi:MAG: hypothetical protein ACHQIL_08655 [Steroidobacterales bacterium]
MKSNSSGLLLAGAIAAILAGCGGGGGGPLTPVPQSGTLSVLASDASTEDWAMIGVKVLSVALVPQGGGANVTVYTAPSPVPVTNLVNLDNLSELLGNASIVTDVPVTYIGAVVTISANPGDVLLTAAADPEPGFEGTPGAPIPAADIQIQDTQGSAPNLTVSVPVKFDSPLTVTPSQASQLDVEFNLRHPAFIVAHTPPALQGTTIWAVDFDGPVRHHPVRDVTRLVLRHMYGDVASISPDNTFMTINKEMPTEPPVSPETAMATGQSVQILADAANGTLLYDLDTHTRTTIMSFTGQSSLVGAQVRIAARYQADGKLVATRIWESTAANAFNNVWLSPEGHVLHVDAANDVVTIEDELGQGVPLTVDANTEFFFRTPANAQADATPIGTGPAFLASSDLVRGFKVHASVVDPLASPLVAQSIDIETAVYDGTISAPTSTGFTYTRTFRTASDDYTYSLDYISASTPNGSDPLTGAAINGFKWWYFAYPTLLDLSIGDWVTVTNDAVNLGGTVGPVPSRGISYALWNDPAKADAWSTNASIVMPSALPLGAAATGLTSSNTFTMTVPGGTVAATIDVSTAMGGATLVYQVDRTNGIVTVSAIDVTTPTGLATLTAALAIAGTPVKVYGVPQLDGSMKAYVLTYFTGTTLPAS